MSELKRSECKKYSIKGSVNLKNWYTMTLWESEKQLNEFYRNGTHLEAMKVSKSFSSKIKSTRVKSNELISWSEAFDLLKD